MPIVFSALIVAAPGVAALLLPHWRARWQCMTEGLVLCAVLLAIANGVIPAAAARGVALSVLIYACQRAWLNQEIRSKPGQPAVMQPLHLGPVAAFAIGSLLQPFGKAAMLHGILDGSIGLNVVFLALHVSPRAAGVLTFLTLAHAAILVVL
jgi:hypothetical protein